MMVFIVHERGAFVFTALSYEKLQAPSVSVTHTYYYQEFCVCGWLDGISAPHPDQIVGSKIP